MHVLFDSILKDFNPSTTVFVIEDDFGHEDSPDRVYDVCDCRMHTLCTFRTQDKAIEWARAQGFTPVNKNGCTL